MGHTRELTSAQSLGAKRQHNRQVILGHIRQAGQLGRAQLARRSGLSTQAVSNIIAGLEAEGLLSAQGTRSQGRGLPAVQYGLCADGGYALGVEIRPDVIFAALIDLLGRPVTSARIDIQASTPEAVLGALSDAYGAFLIETKTPALRVLGAGLVMPGPFRAQGAGGSGVELEGWQSTDAPTAFEATLGLPVVVENDANAAAMAERVNGAAQNLDTYAYIYFGRGLGLGLVRGGVLMKGAYGNAGEIGQIPVTLDGQTLPLEHVVSRFAVQKALADHGIEARTMADLDALYHEDCAPLLAWADRAGQALGQALFMVENLFDPEATLLGGAMPAALIDHLIEATPLSEASVSHRAGRARPRLLRGQAGPRPATQGAAALIINRTFTPPLAA